MKKAASILLMLLFFGGIFSSAIASEEENPAARQERIQAEFDSEHKEIAKELAPLNLGDYNKDFIARLTQRALFEEPFTKQKADRAKITKEITDALLKEGVGVLPEERKIERFLRALSKRVPESGFLSVGENQETYDKFQKEGSISFDTDKVPGAIYVKFNIFKKEFWSADTFKSSLNTYLRAVNAEGKSLFPLKFIFDLRGCPGGDPEEATKMTELFRKVQFDESPKQESKTRTRFLTPPRLMYKKYIRPLDCLNDLYCKNDITYFVNPWFLDKAEKEKSKEFYIDSERYLFGLKELIAWRDKELDKLKSLYGYKEEWNNADFNELQRLYKEDQNFRNFIDALRKLELEYGNAEKGLELNGQWVNYGFAMVKKGKEAEFESFINDFNGWIGKIKNSIEIVVLVDRETASAAELFVALLAQNHNVTIIGDRTRGKIVMGAIYPLVYDKSLVYNKESGKKEPLNQLRILREYHPRLLRGHGFKEPDSNLPPSEEGDLAPIGVLRLSDGYWYNPDMESDPRLKNIHKQGILPDVDVSGLDKDKQLEIAAGYLD